LKNLEEKRRKDPRLQENHRDIFDQWTIFVTNLPDSIKPHTMLSIYSLRWQIELLFKIMKTFLNLREIQYTAVDRTNIALYLSMIALVLLCIIVMTVEGEELSLYKACKIFVRNFREFIEALNSKTKCAISWIRALFARFALKESRASRPSTKKTLDLRPSNA
jgi:hypothetical protein